MDIIKYKGLPDYLVLNKQHLEDLSVSDIAYYWGGWGEVGHLDNLAELSKQDNKLPYILLGLLHLMNIGQQKTTY